MIIDESFLLGVAAVLLSLAKLVWRGAGAPEPHDRHTHHPVSLSFGVAHV